MIVEKFKNSVKCDSEDFILKDTASKRLLKSFKDGEYLILPFWLPFFKKLKRGNTKVLLQAKYTHKANRVYLCKKGLEENFNKIPSVLTVIRLGKLDRDI
jgi:hypothetical protein